MLRTLILAAALTVLGAGAAQAAETAPLQIDRRALGSEAGAAATYKAVSKAARAVCIREGRKGVYVPRAVRACIVDATARAVAAIDAPALTALHEEITAPRPTRRLFAFRSR